MEEIGDNSGNGNANENSPPHDHKPAGATSLNVAREVNGIEVNDAKVEFAGGDGSVLSFVACSFKDVSVTFGGINTTYVFDNCSWTNAKVTFGNNDLAYIFGDPVFVNSVLIGGEGQLTLVNMTSNEAILTSGASFYFGERPTFTNVTLMEEATGEGEELESEQPRVFQGDEDEEVDFIDCNFHVVGNTSGSDAGAQERMDSSVEFEELGDEDMPDD